MVYINLSLVSLVTTVKIIFVAHICYPMKLNELCVFLQKKMQTI